MELRLPAVSPRDQRRVAALPSRSIPWTDVGAAHDGSRARAHEPVVAVVIPSYRVRAHILPLLARIGPEVAHIFVVDDCCPGGSGDLVIAACRDSRVIVLKHEENQGVGGAVLTGYLHALEAGADIIVKIDGDGQMDPALLPRFIDPIARERADYVKGNRFYNVEDARSMPLARLVGNAGLSFLTKLSSGYWNLFDPTNGYTAISAAVASHLPMRKIKRRYFFESDMLFRLGTLQAVVLDMPMTAVYGDEKSGLRIGRVFAQFLFGNLVNFGKRVFYGYFLRGFSIASLQLLVGLAFLLFGVVFGLHGWSRSVSTGVPATTGTVMLAALPVILGVQFLLSFLAFDGASTPSRPISGLLAPKDRPGAPIAAVRSKTRCGSGP